MKKVFVITVAVALMLALLPVSSVVAVTYAIGDMTKTFAVGSASLCENITGTINITVVDDGDLPVTVTDTMPEGLTLGGVSVDPAVDAEDVVFDEDELTVTLDAAGTYIITFWAQVTSVHASETITVTNTANAYDSDIESDSASADLDLLPYEDFVKELADPEDNEQVSRTQRSFDMVVNIENTLDDDIDMLDVYVKDNLPGNIVYDDWAVETGSVEETWGKEGKNQVAHLIWDLEGDLDNGDDVESTLTVFTDIVGGKDGDKHQMKNAGTYTLNPGATLMFTASDTDFACTVRSAPVKVTVVEEMVA